MTANLRIVIVHRTSDISQYNCLPCNIHVVLWLFQCILTDLANTARRASADPRIAPHLITCTDASSHLSLPVTSGHCVKRSGFSHFGVTTAYIQIFCTLHTRSAIGGLDQHVGDLFMMQSCNTMQPKVYLPVYHTDSIRCEKECHYTVVTVLSGARSHLE